MIVVVCWRVWVYECGSLLILCFYLWVPMSVRVLVAAMGVCRKCECVSFCVSLNVSMGDCVVVSALYSFYKDIVRKMPFLKEFYRRYLSLCFKRPSYQSHLPANILEKIRRLMEGIISSNQQYAHISFLYTIPSSILSSDRNMRV